jgi:hypothetical protein
MDHVLNMNQAEAARVEVPVNQRQAEAARVEVPVNQRHAASCEEPSLPPIRFFPILESDSSPRVRRPRMIAFQTFLSQDGDRAVGIISETAGSADATREAVR